MRVLALLGCLAVAHGFAPAPAAGARAAARTAVRDDADANGATLERRDFGALATAAAAASALAVAAPGSAVAAGLQIKEWEQVALPVSTTLFDIAFDTPEHGYLVGAKGTFLETVDGGGSWKPRTFANLDAEEEVGYRFEKVSFKDGEGWVVGKPPILLHTQDAGKSWERIPLSPKLPGEPTGVVALGKSNAEMTTSTGAIYTTSNAGRNWKAQVKETIDATLNRVSSSGVSGASYFTGSVASISRDELSGSYLAVSSRGNFYLTWSPGSDFWIPHNRGTPKRIQAMGFVQGDAAKGLWMSQNGGTLALAESADLSVDTPTFGATELNSGGYGILDVAWKNAKEVWAVGGGGTLYVSRDGGKTFKFDGSADKIPGNLYNVKFFGENGPGFAIGSDGVLLRKTA
ncbi:photosynthesis system II assembly factor Ycf48/Hcf136-like domain-containing protein, partial [Pelagophyceae sp. CCMP2097]